MKRCIVILVALVLYSCAQDTEQLGTEITSLEMASKKSSSNVQLLKVWTANASSPVHQSYIRTFSVKIKNLAFQKEVFIHHATKQGDWIDIPLSYEQSVENNEEIWTAEVDMDSDILDTEFVVKYVVDGQEYWDNNNGLNYNIEENEGAYLASGIQVSLNTRNTKFSGSYFNINADLKHSYSAPIEVEVRYTTDGWATYKTAMLSYQRYYRVGYANYILSPNQFDASVYETSVWVDSSVEAIEFALVYKSEGVEYWDNNYGSNYVLQKSTH